MNKYQEALDRFEEAFRNITLDDNLANERRDLLQELVDRATPMKPTKLENGKYSCNSCAMAFTVKYLKNRFLSHTYCDVCGQALDWSEDE